MTPATLFLILLSVAGVSALRWSLRLAPLSTEFPAKTAIATMLAVLAAAGGLGLVHTPDALRLAALVLGPLYVFAPLLLLALVRAGRTAPARVLMRLLYWTPAGRRAVGRLLAQAAVQAGDAEAALALSQDGDGLLLAQARRLEGDWEGVLAAPLTPAVDAGDPAGEARSGSGAGIGGVPPDNVALGYEARVEALLALGRRAEAAAEVDRLERFYAAGHDSPIAFRALTLAQARLAAEDGDVERVQRLLTQPMVGAGAATLYAVMARAAERAGRADIALKLLAQGHEGASGALRSRLASEIARLGGAVPETKPVAQVKTPVTYVLMAVLAAAYLAQVLVDRLIGPLGLLGQVYDPSTILAAYLQGAPGMPGQGSWWRLVTYAFVHGNIVHIGFNVWVLFDLGRLYERRSGWGDLLAAFLVGTVGGSLLTSVAQAGEPLILVGASGGILGLAGALLADALTRRGPGDSVLLRSLLQWMVLIMLFSVLPGVSLWGHAGGLAGGFLYGLLRSRVPAKGLGPVLGGAAAAVMLAALVTGLVTVVPLLP